jgi:hypothetical protein
MRFTVLIVSIALIVFMAVLVGCERKITNEAANQGEAFPSCFTCHSDHDTDLQAARQTYEYSKHATGDTWVRNRNNGHYQSCERCHTNQGFVAFVEGTEVETDQFSRITCFTCHEPHTDGDLEVRVDGPAELIDGTMFDRGPANLCATCHHAREYADDLIPSTDTLSGHWGPHHSVQADMLLGINAYEYAGYTLDGGYQNSAHTLGVEEACVHCHMPPDLYKTGFHAFYLDDEDAEYENVKSCNDGCHGGTLTTLDHDGVQTEIRNLLDELETELVNAGVMEVVDGEVEPIDGLPFTNPDTLGAIFNWLFVYEDRSKGVHNTNYAMALLQSSINYMQTGDPNGTPATRKPEPIAKLPK